MVASAPAMCKRAKRRAWSLTERLLPCAAARTAAFSIGTSLPDQKSATAVWSAVRLPPLRPPRFLISLKSRATTGRATGARARGVARSALAAVAAARVFDLVEVGGELGA